jgi:hypothetical protein
MNSTILQNKNKQIYHMQRKDTRSVYKKVNIKVKFTIKQATNTQKGSRGIALLFP